MSNAADGLQQARIIVLVGMYWTLAILAPFMLFGLVYRPEPSVTFLFLIIAAYFIYTGYRAWKLRWKARFVLRIVVPVALFLVASVCAEIISLSSRPA